MTTAPERLYEEVSYLAYHFHWSQEELLGLEHPQRRRYCEEIARIRRRLAGKG